MRRTRLLLALDPFVGDAEPDRGEDAVAMGSDGAGQRDKGGQSRSLGPSAPTVDQHADICMPEVDSKDGPQGFLSVTRP